MNRALIISYLSVMLCLASCETIINLDLPDPESILIVEGYIENDVAPYVLLSRNAPFFGGFNINDLGAAFVPNGKLEIISESDTIPLKEYNRDVLANATFEEKEVILPILSQVVGFTITEDIIAFLPDITLYSIGQDHIDFRGKLSQDYLLNFEVNDSILGLRVGSARAVIPPKVVFDSLWIEDHPLEEIDTLVELHGRFKDPDTLGNFYRLLTKVNDGLWLTGGTTVFDDPLINGVSLPFTIFKGEERFSDEDFDQDVTGYWRRGDTASVRFSTLNLTHYRFWRTVENEVGNAGNPFSSFTIVESNIVGEGSFGIWGGYGSSIISLAIPE